MLYRLTSLLGGLPQWVMVNQSLSLSVFMPGIDEVAARNNLKLILKFYEHDDWLCWGTSEQNASEKRAEVVKKVLEWLNVPYTTITVYPENVVEVHEHVPIPKDLLVFLASVNFKVERFR